MEWLISSRKDASDTHAGYHAYHSTGRLTNSSRRQTSHPQLPNWLLNAFPSWPPVRSL